MPVICSKVSTNINAYRARKIKQEELENVTMRRNWFGNMSEYNNNESNINKTDVRQTQYSSN